MESCCHSFHEWADSLAGRRPSLKPRLRFDESNPAPWLQATRRAPLRSTARDAQVFVKSA